MYTNKELSKMTDEAIRMLMVGEHAYLAEDVEDYDRLTMIEILLDIPTIL